MPEVAPVDEVPPATPPDINEARNNTRLHLCRSGCHKHKNQFIFNPDHLTDGDMDDSAFDQCFFSLKKSVFHSKAKYTQANLDSYLVNSLNWHSSVSALLASPDM